jgi:hypothetical protein
MTCPNLRLAVTEDPFGVELLVVHDAPAPEGDLGGDEG